MKVISRANGTIFVVSALAHYSGVALLSQRILDGYPVHELFGMLSTMLLWLLLQPANLVTTSGFGHTLSPLSLCLVFVANSLIWGAMGVLFLVGIRRLSE